MNADQLTECMHAVLDGTASPEQAMTLQAVLASDPGAAEEFESWKSMFGAMSAIPMAHPPEGLVAAVSAAVPSDTELLRAAKQKAAQKKFASVDQLSAHSQVIVSGQARTTRLASGLRAIFHRPSRSDSTQGYGQMNTNRKIWAGSAVAAVAIGVGIVLTGYPPKAENVLGTVVPAERYRAAQSGADAIKLGEQGNAQATQGTDAGGVQAAKTDAQRQAEKADAGLMARKSDAQLQAEKADAGLMARKSDAQLQAEKADAGMMARKSDAQLQAEKADAGLMARKSDAQLQAEKADAGMMARKSDAQRQAEKADAGMMARKSDAQMQAEKADAALRAAQKSDAQMQANKAATN